MFEILSILHFIYQINILDEKMYQNNNYITFVILIKSFIEENNTINFMILFSILFNLFTYFNNKFLNIKFLNTTYIENIVNINYFVIIFGILVKFIELNTHLINSYKYDYLSFLVFNIQIITLKNVGHNFFINISCKTLKYSLNLLENKSILTSRQNTYTYLVLLFGLLCFDTISNIFYHYYTLKIFYLFYYTKKENLYLVLNFCLYYGLYFGKRIYAVYNYIKEAQNFIRFIINFAIRNMNNFTTNIENISQNFNLNRIIINNTNNIVFEKSLIDITKNESCLICFNNNIDTKLEYCGHRIICLNCSRKIDKCPICRKEVKKIIY